MDTPGRATDEAISARAEPAETWQRRAARIAAVLHSGGPELVYQPVVDLRTGVIVGLEALARFPSDPPMDTHQWFAEAATVGLGVDLELVTAGLAVGRCDLGASGIYLSVNLSARALVDRRLDEILADCNPGCLVVEITEHDRVSDYDELRAAIQPLRNRGVRVAVDDTGSGFASLQHVLKLAPEFIKLDPALTRDIDTDPAMRALTRSLVSFADATEATVVAEGIERQGELDALRDLGVRYGQGFHLQRPGPLPTAEHCEEPVIPPL